MERKKEKAIVLDQDAFRKQQNGVALSTTTFAIIAECCRTNEDETRGNRDRKDGQKRVTDPWKHGQREIQAGYEGG